MDPIPANEREFSNRDTTGCVLLFIGVTCMTSAVCKLPRILDHLKAGSLGKGAAHIPNSFVVISSL